IDVAKRYVVQETVGPLQGLGRWIGFGIAGAFCIGLGLVSLLVGLLRLLQTETGDTFQGTLMRIIPYLIVLPVTVVLVALVASRLLPLRAGPLRRASVPVPVPAARVGRLQTSPRRRPLLPRALPRDDGREAPPEPQPPQARSPHRRATRTRPGDARPHRAPRR